YVLFSRPTLDIDRVVRLGAEKETDAASVARYFADQGVPAPLPRDFNFNYLNFYDVQPVQGRRVAHLLFNFPGSNEHRPAIAHVSLISEESFKIDEPPNSFPTSSHTVTFRKGEGFLHLILYTGSTLAPFLRGDDL